MAEVALRGHDAEASPVLTGHFAVFDRWTEIDSHWEGTFLERVAPGAMSKSFRETMPKVLLNHGFDPELADRPLGRVETLKEDDRGAFYEVDLYRGIPELVMDGLRDGAYGASFRFRVIKEEITDEVEPSEHNPRGLPERTIQEAHVMEFGPVTFPAYEEASAGVRSLTDDVFVASLRAKPELRLDELFADWAERNPERAAEIVEAVESETDTDLDAETGDQTGTERADETGDEPEATTHSQEPPAGTPDRGAAVQKPRSFSLQDPERKWRLP